MREIVYLVIAMSTLCSNAQQFTVFYKDKRTAAKSKKKQSGFITSVSLSESALPENDPDSLYVDVRRRVDSLKKIIVESEKYDFDLENIPEYEYTTVLKIDGRRSLYYPQEKVNNDTVMKQVTTKSGHVISKGLINYYDSEIVYIDLELMKKISSLRVYIFDYRMRSFLIDENMKQQDWEITNEHKKIDRYVCHKAILRNSDIPVEAWYTTEIPIKHGPRGYWGLPGLIVELKEGKKLLRFDKISFFSDTISIKPPTEGTQISREKFLDLPSKLFYEDN